MKMMYRGGRLLDNILSKSLVDDAWGEIVFVADGDLNEVEVEIDCL